MTLLSRDQILTADDLATEDTEVPEWGGTVRVRALTGTERDAFEASVASDARTGKKNLANLRARLVALAVVDENGARLFTDKDVVKLGLKNAAPLDRVFDVARKLSGLTEDDVEELVEDFDDAQSEPSTSD